MPIRTSYEQGTPNWTALRTPDREAAQAFYGHLFGWRFDELPGGRPGAVAVKGDGVVAAVTAGSEARWDTYFAVDDVEAVAKAVPEAGGVVRSGPVDVGDAGRAAVIADPTGTAVGLWQAGRHAGATVVGERGTASWHELLTTDAD